MKYIIVVLLVMIFVLAIFLTICSETFEDTKLELLIREALGKSSGDISASELKGLKALEARGKEIKSLRGIECCSSLLFLLLERNSIIDLSPLAGLTSLETLALNENQISDISPLAGLASLKWLILKGNPLNDEARNVIIPKFTKEGVEVYYK
jgi:Leucine-rich repeat (LRR) protein